MLNLSSSIYVARFAICDRSLFIDICVVLQESLVETLKCASPILTFPDPFPKVFAFISVVVVLLVARVARKLLEA